MIVRDNDNRDVFYYKNMFTSVKTRVISDSV